MPAARKTQNNRGLYVHNAESVTKASTGSKSGHIRTLINHHAAPGSVELAAGASMETDGVFDMPVIPLEDDGDDIAAPCVSGIRVKPKAKRYQNSVSSLSTS
jgi:hypothetical protein